MNSAALAQLVAYLKAMAANNQGKNVQTNQQAASGSNLSNQFTNSLIKKGVKEGVKYGWQQYGAPLWEEYVSPIYSSGTASGAGAGAAEGGLSETATIGATNVMGGALGSEGLAGVSLGGAASLAAPLIMAYLKYQAGSGENTPVRKQYETRGAGKMLSDMIGGKTIDPKNTYQDYGLYPRSIPSWLDPNSTKNSERGPGAETIDPRGYAPEELYGLMHSYGTGARQQQGLGNSGYSDQQIDDMFGDQKGGLSKLLGGDTPDWSKTTWDSSGWTAPNTVNKQKELTDKLGAMSQSERGDVMNRNRQWLPEGGALNDQFYLESLEREREREELEKLLGYKLGG